MNSHQIFNTHLPALQISIEILEIDLCDQIERQIQSSYYLSSSGTCNTHVAASHQPHIMNPLGCPASLIIIV